MGRILNDENSNAENTPKADSLMTTDNPKRELPLLGRDIPFSAIEGELCRVVNFGNLSTWWQGRDYTYELALIDLYYFKTLDGRDVYQLEWAAPQTAHLEAYTKLNFDAAKKRVRIMFIDLDLNSEAKFFGEYINLETASVIKFIGERGQRQEVY